MAGLGGTGNGPLLERSPGRVGLAEAGGGGGAGLLLLLGCVRGMAQVVQNYYYVKKEIKHHDISAHFYETLTCHVQYSTRIQYNSYKIIPTILYTYRLQFLSPLTLQ